MSGLPVCHFFQRGLCRYGNACRYSHGEEGRSSSASSSKTVSDGEGDGFYRGNPPPKSALGLSSSSGLSERREPSIQPDNFSHSTTTATMTVSPPATSSSSQAVPQKSPVRAGAVAQANSCVGARSTGFVPATTRGSQNSDHFRQVKGVSLFQEAGDQATVQGGALFQPPVAAKLSHLTAPPSPYGNYCTYLEYHNPGSVGGMGLQHPPVCRYFAEGFCKFGEACRFLHPSDGPLAVADRVGDGDQGPQVATPSVERGKSQPVQSKSRPEDGVEVVELSTSIGVAGQSVEEGHRPVTLSDLEILSLVGDGMMAKVHQVRLKRTGKIYAMKTIHKQKVLELDALAATQLERDIMTMQPPHPFVARLHYAFQTSAKLYMLMDFLPGGDIGFHLNSIGNFPEDMARFYAGEIVLALGYLHRNGIAYRDLKADNTLIDVDGHIRLSDFGLSKRLDDPSRVRSDDGEVSGEGRRRRGRSNSFCGTCRYMAPEIIDEASNHEHDYQVDMWALGVLLFRMLTGLFPFEGSDQDEVRAVIADHAEWSTTEPDATRKMIEEIPEEELLQPVSRAATQILCDLLEPNPSKRATSESVRNHPFFAGLQWNALSAKALRPPWVPYFECGEEDTAHFPSDYTSTTPGDSYVESISAEHPMFDRFNFAGISPSSMRHHDRFPHSFGVSPSPAAAALLASKRASPHESRKVATPDSASESDSGPDAEGAEVFDNDFEL